MERLFARMGKNRFLNLIILGRIWNALVAGLFSILGVKIAMGILPDPLTSVALLVVTIFVYMGCAGLNDIFDIKTDSINMPFRPIQSKRVNLKEAGYFTVLTFFIGLIISILLSVQYFFSVLLMALMGIAYSLKPVSLKDRGFVGNVALGITTVLLTGYSGFVLFTGSLIIGIFPLYILFSLALFFTFFSILKDFKDMRGDRYVNKNTIPLKHGKGFASMMNITGTSVFFYITVLLVYFLYLPHPLFLATSTVFFLLILFQEYKVLKNPNEKTGENSWGISRLLVLLFVISLMLF